jgi:Protein of unknown function (DUF2563)
MWVEPDVLKDGADVSRNAGKMARSGADALDQVSIPAGMFGDFDAADAFHSKLTAGHRSHVMAMRGNHQTLSEVGERAHQAAISFEATEAQNTAAIDNVPDA